MYQDIKIDENPMRYDNDKNDDKDRESKSNEKDDLFLHFIIGISSILGISSLAITLSYIKKRILKLFKSRAKEIS